jgi:hypothetical protein
MKRRKFTNDICFGRSGQHRESLQTQIVGKGEEEKTTMLIIVQQQQQTE